MNNIAFIFLKNSRFLLCFQVHKYLMFSFHNTFIFNQLRMGVAECEQPNTKTTYELPHMRFANLHELNHNYFYGLFLFFLMITYWICKSMNVYIITSKKVPLYWNITFNLMQEGVRLSGKLRWVEGYYFWRVTVTVTSQITLLLWRHKTIFHYDLW